MSARRITYKVPARKTIKAIRVAKIKVYKAKAKKK